MGRRCKLENSDRLRAVRGALLGGLENDASEKPRVCSPGQPLGNARNVHFRRAEPRGLAGLGSSHVRFTRAAESREPAAAFLIVGELFQPYP
jgi:hypothetical protein